MIDVGRHPLIELLTYSEVEGLRGSRGDFRVRVRQKSRAVDERECTGCGDCARQCPVVVPSEFEEGIGARKAIYIPFQQAVPFVYLVDRQHCLNDRFLVCQNCVRACDKKCIDFDRPDQLREIEAGAVIVATGFDHFDPTAITGYGYTRFNNVLHSLEFERLSNSTGPTAGEIVRLTDRRPVRSLGFVNCVGSRDMHYNPYCSNVCCMFSTKQAMVAREHNPQMDSTLFYTDLRAGGKGFQKYIDKGAEAYGIRYVRSRVSKITVDAGDNPVIWHEDTETGRVSRQTVDMAVLAITLVPAAGVRELARVLGIELDPYDFVRTPPGAPVETTRAGVFTCGYSQSPMGISQAVTMASAAASRAAEEAFSAA